MAKNSFLKYYKFLRPFLKNVDIYRYVTNSYGEITTTCNKVCTVLGYPYNKYLQIIRNVINSADITNMKNERMLILPNKSVWDEGYPEIKSGDRYFLNGARYRVIFVQDNGELKTLVAEREA